MYIRRIHVENYRNLHNLTMSFHEDVNYLVGESSVGKSNLLDLIYYITSGRGFEESDFYKVNRPIRIEAELSLSEVEGTPVDAVHLRIEQVVQEVYPRVYAVNGDSMEEIPLSMLRHAFYVCHREQHTVRQYSTLHHRARWWERVPKDTLLAIVRDHTADNVRLISKVVMVLVDEIERRMNSAAIDVEAMIVEDAKGRRLLPILISVDEPELHLSPYLQRSILNYYKSIVTNQNELFLDLLKKLFNIDGLLGQLFIVTNSTDALVDDYRHIIRLHKDEEGLVRAACGMDFNFPKEVEKHLIMHFPEMKEPLYARAVILVEGETEYGAFAGFAQQLESDFDYYGICLINARGEASIDKLYRLFTAFGVPGVCLYDRDVEAHYGHKKPYVFYTDTICFEMDVVSHVLGQNKRKLLDAIIEDLEDSRGDRVTSDMIRKAIGKLGPMHQNYSGRQLKHISDRKYKDLLFYYFAWFYAHKGVLVGRRIAERLTGVLIPPAFIRVIDNAKAMAMKTQHRAADWLQEHIDKSK